MIVILFIFHYYCMMTIIRMMMMMMKRSKRGMTSVLVSLWSMIMLIMSDNFDEDMNVGVGGGDG